MNGIPPTISELFCRTHQRRNDNSWVDKKLEQVNVMDYYLLRVFFILLFYLVYFMMLTGRIYTQI